MSQDLYPNLKAAIEDGRVDLNAEPPKRTQRCGPWTEQPDGTFVCDKCGEIDAPGDGPNGF
jgi:hypothetical protein